MRSGHNSPLAKFRKVWGRFLVLLLLFALYILVLFHSTPVVDHDDDQTIAAGQHPRDTNSEHVELPHYNHQDEPHGNAEKVQHIRHEEKEEGSQDITATPKGEPTTKKGVRQTNIKTARETVFHTSDCSFRALNSLEESRKKRIQEVTEILQQRKSTASDREIPPAVDYTIAVRHYGLEGVTMLQPTNVETPSSANFIPEDSLVVGDEDVIQHSVASAPTFFHEEKAIAENLGRPLKGNEREWLRLTRNRVMDVEPQVEEEGRSGRTVMSSTNKVSCLADETKPNTMQWEYCKSGVRPERFKGHKSHDNGEEEDGKAQDDGELQTPCLVDITFGRSLGLKDNNAAQQWSRQSNAMGSRANSATFAFYRPVNFYGLASRGAHMKLDDRRASLHLKNLDINHYKLTEELGLYGALPLALAMDERDPNRRGTVGILWLNAAPLRVVTEKSYDMTKISFYSSEGGVKVFLLPGPTPKDILRQYYMLTGAPMLPPLFSLGYHQSRWSYLNQNDVLEVNKKFDIKHIPCDAIWLDIDHTDDRRYFTWDARKFPDSIAMQRELWKNSERRMVTVSDPHIKVDRAWYVWKEADKNEYFVKNDVKMWGSFKGHCWPGESSWIDFANPKARSWYATLFGYDRYKGSTEHLYTWNDMNEPSVFSGPEITFPMSVGHQVGAEGLVYNHGQLHNMYGFYHTMATFEGHLYRSKNKDRPFALTRSFFPGSQRHVAAWTGDNQAKWEHLEASIEMILMTSMCGMPFVGADVGGFFDVPESALIRRWYQLASLYPFFRGHSHEATPRREPWLHDDQTNAAVAAAIRFRYMLLPYIYSTYAIISGVVPFRALKSTDEYVTSLFTPLFFEFPHDKAARELTSTFSFGRDLLAAPIVKRNTDKYTVQLPNEESAKNNFFYDFWTGEVHKGGQVVSRKETAHSVVPLFIRSGSIIPMRTHVGKSSVSLPSQPLRLVVALDGSGTAKGRVYLDDTKTYFPAPTSRPQSEDAELEEDIARAETLHSCSILLKASQSDDRTELYLTASVDALTCSYAHSFSEQDDILRSVIVLGAGNQQYRFEGVVSGDTSEKDNDGQRAEYKNYEHSCSSIVQEGQLSSPKVSRAPPVEIMMHDRLAAEEDEQDVGDLAAADSIHLQRFGISLMNQRCVEELEKIRNKHLSMKKGRYPSQIIPLWTMTMKQ